MYKGRILATLEAQQATREQLGLLMAGVTSSEPEKVVDPHEGVEDLRQEGRGSPAREEGTHV